jgi:hypothetical protein
MGGLIFILPILAFDIWLISTTGKRQWQRWRERREWNKIVGVIGAGILLAVYCAFFVAFKNGTTLKLRGFPVPFIFSTLENNEWTTTTSPGALAFLARLTDFFTGLVAPLIPFKIGEFLRVVKEELK